MISVDTIRIEHRECPIGINVRRPRFSWQIVSDARNVRQSRYRLQVATDNTVSDAAWDSGEVVSDTSIQVEYDAPTLRPATWYFFRVADGIEDAVVSHGAGPL